MNQIDWNWNRKVAKAFKVKSRPNIRDFFPPLVSANLKISNKEEAIWIQKDPILILGCPRKLGSMVSKWVITYL